MSDFSKLNGYDVKDRQARQDIEDLQTSILNNIKSYETVVDMINDTTLLEGMHVETKGYYAPGDNGNGKYIIVDDITLIEDGGSIIDLNNGLKAQLILDNLTFSIFGAYGDGVHDDTESITNCINYAKANSLNITSLKNKIYLISETIDFSELYVNLNNSVITTNEEIEIITINTNSNNQYTKLENIIIDCNNIADIGLNIVESRRCKYNNLNFRNVHNIGIDIKAGYENMFENINMQTSGINTSTVGIKIEVPDNHFSNICMTNLKIAFDMVKGGSILDRIHCWIGDSNLINGSILFKLENTEETYLNLSQVYCDTYQNCFEYVGNYTVFLYCDQLLVNYNNSIYTSDKDDSYIIKCNTLEQSRNIKLTNSFILGLSYDNTKTYICNMAYIGDNINCNILRASYSNVFDVENLDQGLAGVERAKIIKDGKTITLEIIASYNSATGTGDYRQFIPLGKIPYYLAPNRAITTSCLVSDSRWDWYDASNGYCYIANNVNTLNDIQVRAPRGTGTKYIYINATWNL